MQNLSKKNFVIILAAVCPKQCFSPQRPGLGVRIPRFEFLLLCFYCLSLCSLLNVLVSLTLKYRWFRHQFSNYGLQSTEHPQDLFKTFVTVKTVLRMLRHYLPFSLSFIDGAKAMVGKIGLSWIKAQS